MIRYLLILILLLTGCEFEPKRNSVKVCEVFCKTQRAPLLQMSSGICLCDNEEGRKAADAYHAFINNACPLRKNDEFDSQE